MNQLNELIDGVLRLEALSVAGVWAFFTLVLIVFLTWLLRTQKQSSEKAWEARIEEAKADGMIASALEKLRDEIRELRHRVKCGGSND